MFLKSINSLRAGFVAVVLVANAQGATVPLFENNVQFLSPPLIVPQIDATTFVNNSIFSVSTSGGIILVGTGSSLLTVGVSRFPFETSNTRFFVNHGSMFHGDGFRIDRQSGSGRTWLNTFENSGSIEAGLYLELAATNIHSSGIIASSADGLLKISGQTVDLRDSGIKTGSSATIASTTFSTVYWGRGANQRMTTTNGGFRINGPNFTLPAPFSPIHEVIQLFGGAAFQTFAQVPNFVANGAYDAFVYTSGNNVQVVFAPINDFSEPALRTDVRFGSQGGPGSPVTPVVEFSLPEYDFVTDTSITNYLYFSDASLTLGTNFLSASAYGGQQPAVYSLSSFQPFAWFFGVPANDTLRPNLLYNPTFVTNVVTNTYSAYSASYGPLLNSGTGTAPDVTNSLGRIELQAESLNAKNLRVRAESAFLLKAKNLVDNQFPIVDAPFVSYDLGSASGMLTLTNLANATIKRFSGTISAWSMVWNNQTTNTGSPVLNFHVLILEHIFNGSASPQVDSLVATATNVAITGAADTINRRLVLNTKSLTVGASGSLGYSSNGTNTTAGINSNNTPILSYVTNLGVISVPGVINLGSDRPLPLSNILNQGQMIGAALFLRSSSLMDSGFLVADAGAVELDFSQGKFAQNVVLADSNIRVRALDLVASNSFLSAGYFGGSGKLDIIVTNSLIDAGSAGSNHWETTDGFALGRRPAISSLLGTTIESVVNKFKNASHVWASTNLGPVAAGYVNNAAIGRLVLNSVTNFTAFSFSGVGTNSAIYVDYLEFKNFPTNFESIISIAPNFTIYFADSNLKAERLDGALGGRIRWVNSFAGPNSSVTVTNQSGVALKVNRQLATSTTIDSDGDGIKNAFDPFPFEYLAPFISSAPTNQTVNIGGTLSISAGIRGTPPLIYQWIRNGVPLKGATNAILVIPNVQSANAGSYQIMVGNGSISATSSAAVITVVNPFLGRAGAYSGLIGNPTNFQFSSSGFAQLSLTINGTFSGQIRIEGGTYPLSGKLDSTGSNTVQVARTGKTTLVCRFMLDLVGSNTITGTVGDGVFSVPIHLDRTVFSASRPAPYAGKYTLAIPGVSPVMGDGIGTLTVSSSGSATFSGVLADGTVASQTANVSESGRWPVYLPLYVGKGMLISWVQLKTNAPATLVGSAVWTKNPVGGKYYPLGFRIDTSVQGNAYVPPSSGVRVLNLINGTVTLSSGNLAASITNSVVLGGNNLLTISGVNNLNLTVTLANGLVNGSFKHPITTLITPIRGVVRQGTNLVQGHFLGTDQSGALKLVPAP